MKKFLNKVRNYPLRFLFIFSILIIPGYVISATIEVTDEEGNFYTLYEDGTYKKMEKKRLSDSDIANRFVAVIASTRTFYGGEVSQEQKDCIRKMVLDNKGKKWKQLNFANQPWPTTLEWLDTLAIVEGNVTDVIKLMGGLIYWNGLNIAAEEYCGLELT